MISQFNKRISVRGGGGGGNDQIKLINILFLRYGLNPANTSHSVRENGRQHWLYLNWEIENHYPRRVPVQSSFAAIHLL